MTPPILADADPAIKVWPPTSIRFVTAVRIAGSDASDTATNSSRLCSATRLGSRSASKTPEASEMAMSIDDDRAVIGMRALDRTSAETTDCG